jgi:hypothetical protein
VWLAFSLGLISAAAIGYEILLMRLYSIVLWHNFAYMIISVALLGYSASGVYLAFRISGITERYIYAYTINATLFGFFSVVGFAVAQIVPFNPLEIAWDIGQQTRLLAIYLSLFLPFFFAANCVGLTLARYSNNIASIYLCNLIGAGFGALGIITGLVFFFPSTCLEMIGAAGFASAALACFDNRFERLKRFRWIFGFIAALSLFVWPNQWLKPQPSQYKQMSQALLANEAKIIDSRSSPLGLVSVVESPVIPFRYAPGLSLNNTVEPPEQLAIFTDGGSMSAITRNSEDRAQLAYLDYLTWALPFHLLDNPSVLVIGAGGGVDVLMAQYFKASSIDAVELNPQVVDIVRRVYASFAGNIYSAKNVRIHIAEGRGFVAGSEREFDLIQAPLIHSFSASSAGVGALSENYLYTVEALGVYLGKLKNNGYLVITGWLKLPPRDSLKLFATAIEALESSGVADPIKQLVLIRSWNTVTLLLKNGELTQKDNDIIRAFCRARSFDIARLPGLKESEANVSNILEEPYLFNGALALLGQERRSFLERYKFNIVPSTDDSPYFFRFFKWAALPEILSKGRWGGFSLLEHGYLVLTVTLVQVALVCVIFITSLYIVTRRRRPSALALVRVGLYFASLGLGFMFIEIVFIQKFILFLNHPLHSVAVVLGSFLIFAGFGSGCSSLIPGRYYKTRNFPIKLAVSGIALIVLIYMAILPQLFSFLFLFSGAVKILISILLIAPLAFFMGMPFPLGLTYVATKVPELVPWAWGVNGAASVMGAILATILSIHFGFSTVLIIAVILYACLFFPLLLEKND